MKILPSSSPRTIPFVVYGWIFILVLGAFEGIHRGGHLNIAIAVGFLLLAVGLWRHTQWARQASILIFYFMFVGIALKFLWVGSFAFMLNTNPGPGFFFLLKAMPYEVTVAVLAFLSARILMQHQSWFHNRWI